MAQPSAFENVVSTLPGGVASGDLSADQYKFVVVDSAAEIAVNAANGGACDGVLQTNPDLQGKAATVWGPGSRSQGMISTDTMSLVFDASSISSVEPPCLRPISRMLALLVDTAL